MSISNWPLYLILVVLIGCSPKQGIEVREQGVGAAEEEVLYVDVRTTEEFAAGHITGAMHIPYDEMEQRWPELELYRERPIVLYCRSGRRSGIAEEILRAKGFSDLENGGALVDLAEAGIPTTP